MEEVKIPKNMGYGEGSETLPKLGKILHGIVGNINDLATRVEAVEAAVEALEDEANDLITRVEALEDEANDLIARIEALEGEGEGGGD